jgi:hypothetical protein
MLRLLLSIAHSITSQTRCCRRLQALLMSEQSMISRPLTSGVVAQLCMCDDDAHACAVHIERE